MLSMNVFSSKPRGSSKPASHKSSAGGRRFGSDLTNQTSQSRAGVTKKSSKNTTTLPSFRRPVAERTSSAAPVPLSHLPPVPPVSVTDVMPSHRATRAAPAHKSVPRSPARDIDTDFADPMQVSDYAQEIHSYYKNEEIRNRVSPYMERQSHINKKMRAILVDWLVEVASKFKLNPESLYLTVSIIDRFLSKRAVRRQQLQLVGVSAMLLASKYEEIYFPEVRDFVFITDRAYTRRQILAMESKVLSALSFELTVPTAHKFLQRYQKAAGDLESVTNLSNYLCERTLQEYSSLSRVPSEIAAASVLVAREALGATNPWSATLERVSGYSESTLSAAAEEIRAFARNTTTSLQAVKKKYASSKFGRSSNVRI